MLEPSTIERLDEQMRGQLITREHEAYPEARAIYNAMIEKKPAEVAVCSDVADVIAGVETARESGELLAVRGGGHNGPGLGTCDGGLVLDLGRMNGVRVDSDAGTVRVQGGATWGDVDHATHPFGLAIPSGIISTTGVGGLTLGGGHGYLSRKYGLTIDSLLEADIVLADGRRVTASEDENPDLFWAIRGGGGNFGVVTSFLFEAHPVEAVYGGPMLFPLEAGAECLRWYENFIKSADEDAYAFFGFMVVPPSEPFPEELHLDKVCALQWCHLGSKEAAEATFEEAREVATPVFEHVGELPYPMLQQMYDRFYPPGLQWYWKGDFFDGFDEATIELHLEHADRLPTPLSTMHLYPINGRVHDVDVDETAWAHRDATWSAVYAGVGDDPEQAEVLERWASDYWEALHPHSVGAAYVNFMMREGRDRVQATYGPNYERLTQVKAKYDPENLFRVNQNIEPAS